METQALRNAGLPTTERPRAKLTPDERHHESPTESEFLDTGTGVLAAWSLFDDGPSLLHALAEQGLRLVESEISAEAK